MLVMPHARVNGLEIYHETVGDPGRPHRSPWSRASAPRLVEWDPELCAG